MARNHVPELFAEPTGKVEPGLRCRACQLQLCKSRVERPHAGLTEISRDEADRSVRYECQTCATVLVCSADTGKPGWTVTR